MKRPTAGKPMTQDVDSAAGADEFLWEVHKYTNEYIRFADTKAAFIAGASTALIGALVASSLFNSCLRLTPCNWSKSQWVAAIGLALLSTSLTLSILAIKPRLWNRTTIGYISWDSITGHGNPQKFSLAFHGLSAIERSTAISDHLFILAKIAKRKYAYVAYALATGAIGGALTAAVLFVQHALK